MSVDVDMQVGQHVNKFLNELEEDKTINERWKKEIVSYMKNKPKNTRLHYSNLIDKRNGWLPDIIVETENKTKFENGRKVKILTKTAAGAAVAGVCGLLVFSNYNQKHILETGVLSVGLTAATSKLAANKVEKNSWHNFDTLSLWVIVTVEKSIEKMGSNNEAGQLLTKILDTSFTLMDHHSKTTLQNNDETTQQLTTTTLLEIASYGLVGQSIVEENNEFLSIYLNDLKELKDGLKSEIFQITNNQIPSETEQLLTIS